MMEFDLIGDIGIDITPIQVSTMLASAEGEDVTFYIGSLGGSLTDGQTIYGLIKKYKGKTKGVIVGNTASAGTIAILGCDTVEAYESAPFLIHNSSDTTGGNARELKEKAVMLEKLDKMIVSIYKEKTGLPEDKINELMLLEDWLTPAEAQEYGFIDSITTNVVKAVAYYPNNKLSSELLNKLENKMKNPFKKNVETTYLLALKDGQHILASAEQPELGVEVAPVNAASLEDGSYELADGRTIKIADGKIEEVKEKEAQAAEESTQEIIDTVVDSVTEVVAAKFNEMQATFDAKIEALKITGSKGKAPRDTGTPKGQERKIDVHARVKEKVQANFNKIKAKREE